MVLHRIIEHFLHRPKMLCSSKGKSEREEHLLFFVGRAVFACRRQKPIMLHVHRVRRATITLGVCMHITMHIDADSTKINMATLAFGMLTHTTKTHKYA